MANVLEDDNIIIIIINVGLHSHEFYLSFVKVKICINDVCIYTQDK